MGYILSCSTTPKRIDNLISILSQTKLRCKFFVINICAEYRRFGKFKIPKTLMKLVSKNKKIVFQFMDDMGPITKLMGGYKFIQKKKLIHDKLIIIDDDIHYNPDLFYDLMDNKKLYNLTCGSGFNVKKNKRYTPTEGDCEYAEGFGGICFDYHQYDKFLSWYVSFYKHFDFKSDNPVDKYLAGSFLGDDFIISNIYHNKYGIEKGRKYLSPLDYGSREDALHNNNMFGSNMGTYSYLENNKTILQTFQHKFELNQEIKKTYIKPTFNEKVCVFTWYDDNCKSYGDITSEINKKYCEKEGYTFYKDSIRRVPERTGHWERLPLFVKLMDHMKYDYLIWIDADACFRPHDGVLKEMINKYHKYDIIWSYDYPYTKQINSGFIILKCNDYSLSFMKHLLQDKDDRWFHKPNWDQNKINEYYNKNIMDIQDHSCVLAHMKLQDFYNTNKDAMILHLAGQSEEKRIKTFTEIKNSM